MSNDTNFIGQPTFVHLLILLVASKELEAGKDLKMFTNYNHVVIMLFSVFEGYHSIRDTVLGLLLHTKKLQYLGLDYIMRHSNLSDANLRRPNLRNSRKKTQTSKFEMVAISW